MKREQSFPLTNDELAAEVAALRAAPAPDIAVERCGYVHADGWTCGRVKGHPSVHVPPSRMANPPAPETRVSYSCPHCGREYDRPAPAPETPAPDAMPEIQAGDLVWACGAWCIVTPDLVEWVNDTTLEFEAIQRNGVVIWRRQETQP